MKNIQQVKIKNTKVAITGMGIVSALGNNVEENLDALINARSGISNPNYIITKHAPSIKVGEVRLSNEELSSQLKLRPDHNYTRTALLGSIAALEALNSAEISSIETYKTALISATTVGGMDMTEQHFNDFKSNQKSQKYISSHKASDSTQKIAEQLGITEMVTTISTACSSAANAIMLGARLIKAGKIDRAIVGGTDALSKFTINGFKTLMIFSGEICTPFDADRNGLNLGEAAAYLVLESDKVVQKENKKVLGYLSGYGNANDAFHQTASSENGEGAYLAMKKALEIAKINPAQIDYINAHGTATPNNDLSESIALLRIFDENVPDFSSTKAFTGHTLAAAGAVEAVISILSLQNKMAFPNLGFKSPIPETGLIPLTYRKKKNIHHILSNSFGFGGNCTTLIFSKE